MKGIAFKRFEEIEKLSSKYEKHKAWLEDYEGMNYSIAEKGVHKMKWVSNPQKYDSKHHNHDINVIKELPYRLRIEFDDKDKKGDKDKKKIAKHIEEIKEIFHKKQWGYIESTHHGASNYIWLEFTRNLTDKEKEAFLCWIAPENSEIDLNFASSKKVFPILYTTHWKHSDNCELPINYFKGSKIDFDSLDIKIDKKNILKRKIKNRGFEYITGIKEAAKVFTLEDQTQKFNEIQPLFYDRAGLFWLWNHNLKRWEVVDEVDILNMIADVTQKDVISSKSRTEILNALKQKGRKNIPKPIKDTWIQFKDEIYDITTGEKFRASPEYFVTNPIPYKVSGDPRTPTIDKILAEWVGKDYIKTLHQIIAYCCLPDYPLNRIFCFIGGGSNGKSCFLNLIRKFIGGYNVCSTELDTLLNSRFEVTRLHKKLVCQMGETNLNELDKTSLLKKLSGKDLIGFEYKRKDPFEEINYAKIIISTNSLPETNDKTIGFYRRWLIIDFPNQFSEKKEILDEIPEEEFNNLATNCLFMLNEILENRTFEKEGTVEERMKKYEEKSDPVGKFLEEFVTFYPEGVITKNQFEKNLNSWLNKNRLRKLSNMEIAKKLKEKGIEGGRTRIDWWENGKLEQKQARCWLGIRWKIQDIVSVTDVTDVTGSPT